MPTSTPLRHPWRSIAAAALLLGGCIATAVAAPPGEDDARALPDKAASGGLVPGAKPVVDLVQSLLAMPLEVARVTSGFAMRRHPIKKHRHHHAGVDFAARHGAPVRTVGDGVVAFAGTQSGYGNVIYIEHGLGGRTTVYAHLDRIDVRKGQQLRQGDTIGTVGSTGLATGPHLHFEVREGGKPIDPMSLAYEAVMDPRTPMPQAHDAMAQAPPDTHAMSAQCVGLLQKASLEALDSDELDLLRQGCIR